MRQVQSNVKKYENHVRVYFVRVKTELHAIGLVEEKEKIIQVSISEYNSLTCPAPSRREERTRERPSRLDKAEEHVLVEIQHVNRIDLTSDTSLRGGGRDARRALLRWGRARAPWKTAPVSFPKQPQQF